MKCSSANDEIDRRNGGQSPGLYTRDGREQWTKTLPTTKAFYLSLRTSTIANPLTGYVDSQNDTNRQRISAQLQFRHIATPNLPQSVTLGQIARPLYMQPVSMSIGMIRSFLRGM